jgi:small subunit ribosomal protein S3Ae
MAYGKNKGLAKAGKKGAKKKQMDPFLRKVWYNIKAPLYFKSKGTKVGRTCVTKTTGNKTETDGLKGRVAEFNVADIVDGSEDGHKKVKLEVQEIQGRNCLTDFHGMSLTRDKMCQMIRKKHSLIETVADCKTTDGYVVRLFVIAFTKAQKDQVSVFCFAQSAQIKKIRAKITSVLQGEVSRITLSELVKHLLVDKIEKDIITATTRIFPLEPVHIQKVKIVKKPKMDITKLMEIHDKAGDDDGFAVDEAPEAENTLTAEVK